MNVTVLIFSIAFLAGAAMLVLGWEVSGRWAFLSSRAQRRLQQAETPELHEQAFDRLPAGSLGRKIAEAGWPLSITQFRLGSLGLGFLAALLCWKFFYSRTAGARAGRDAGLPAYHDPERAGALARSAHG
jgi:hypothetical protein